MYFIFGILYIFLGLILVKFPTILWFIVVGWKLNDAEPSEMALGINRFIGYFLLVVGLCNILFQFI